MSEPVIYVAKIMAQSADAAANSIHENLQQAARQQKSHAAKAHQNTPSFNRKSHLTELGMSQLHHYVGPDNISELQAIHKDAYPTAIFYLSTILGLYVLGLFVILVHYMNSSYGKWAWTLNDVWDELRPSFFKGQPSQDKSLERDKSLEKKPRGSNNVICDDEEECHLHNNKPKKVSNHCQKSCFNSTTRSMFESRGLYCCSGGSSSVKLPKPKLKEAEEKEPLHNCCSSSLSTSQRTNTISSCVLTHQNKQTNNGNKIEVVTVDVIDVDHYQHQGSISAQETAETNHHTANGNINC